MWLSEYFRTKVSPVHRGSGKLHRCEQVAGKSACSFCISMHQAAQEHRIRETARHLVVDTWQSEANLSFFLALVVLMTFVFPLTKMVSEHLNVYVDISYTLVLISGIAIAWRRRIVFWMAVVLGAASLIVRWACWWDPNLLTAREALMLANVLFLAAVLLDQVLAKGHVTITRIQGAIAVYLLLGIGWAHAYQIVNAVNPGAFVVQTGTPSTVSEWLYFSFVTLTTVGFGDIVPTARSARMLAVGEALTGQLYLAVLIARLVALQVSESMSADN